MVSTESYISNLSLPTWFKNAGHGIHENDFSGQPVTYITALDEAIAIWEQNFDNRCELWEDLRIKLLKDMTWKNDFDKVRSHAWEILQANLSFLNLANEFYQRVNLEPELLCSQLPVLGYWGELLLQIDNGRYKQEIDIFKKGYFVCGRDDKWIIY